MSNYKTHLIITDKKGNWKRYACNKRGEQWETHDANEVTCLICQSKINTGLVVEGYGYIHSKRLK